MTAAVRRALLPTATAAEIRSYLRPAAAGQRGRALVLTLVMAGQSAAGLAPPIAIGWLVEALTRGRGVGALPGPLLLLVVAAVAQAALGWVATVLLARVVLPVVSRLREDAVETALGLPIGTVEAAGSGDLVARVSGDAELVADVAGQTLGSFLGAALALLAALVGLAALDWRFALAGLLAVPIQAHTLRWYLRMSRPIYAAGRAAEGRRATALLAGFTALPTLRALRWGAPARERIAEASREAMTYEFRVTRAATRFYGRLNLAEYVGLAAILGVGYLLVDGTDTSIGAATTAALFFVGLFDPINTVLGLFDGIQQAGAGVARLVGVIEAGRTGPAPTRASAGSLPAGVALAARDLAFGYAEGSDVLRDVSLRVPSGTSLAVVGASGSGKSTLASLLAGLRAPRGGTLAVADDAGRTPVALVTQETHLFAGTVADNLRLASPEASVEAIATALAEVGADRWVAALPQAEATPIGAGGHPLTAAQAQQLALARLLLLDPAVVVLDEATAEAGSDHARDLDRAAEAVTRGRTAVTVAHRLTQVATADHILVMDAGRVVEAGTHRQLLDAGGRYAALWASWTGEA